MEELFKDSVQLSKGINIKELIGGQAEFHIDIDFKKKSTGSMGACDEDLFPDMDDDSDSEDAFKTIEQSAEKMMLSCPEYHSFKDLAAKMVDCVPSGDVKMLVIEEGDGPLVPVDAMVTIHYAAYFEKAKIPFDSTLTMNNQAPLRMRLGCGRFIPGLEIGLTSVKGPTARFHLLLEPCMAWGRRGVFPRIRTEPALFRMRLGCGRFIPGLEIGLTSVKGPTARFHLLLEPCMAWGRRGVFPRIRPEPALFVIVLYQVDDTQAAARFNDLPSEEQKKFEITTKTVTSLHSHAKHLFAKKKYTQAVKDYQQSITILNISQTSNENEENEVKKLKVNSYVNLCVCYYKLNKPKYIINMCDNLDYITDIEKHCKALFYYGRAHEMLGKHDKAIVYYKKALKLEPKNKEIGNALANIDKYNLKSAETEKELWQNAFRSMPEKKKVVYDVDEDFKNGVIEMCQSLAERNEYSKFDLPNGLTKDEVECIKDLTSKFEHLVVLEDGEGRKKKISIVKRLMG